MVLNFFFALQLLWKFIKCRFEDLIAVGGHGLRNTDFSGEPSSIHTIGAVPLLNLHLLFDGEENMEVCKKNII